MIPSKRRWKPAGLLVYAALVGCMASETPEPGSAETERAAVADGGEPVSEARATIEHYLSKLPDRDYVKTYGGPEHPRTWYTAAEALGEIGKPAVPALIERLDSPDPYELMLALYALMLASQDPALMAETEGDYLRLGTVLTPDTNEENRRLALDWWRRHQHLWR